MVGVAGTAFLLLSGGSPAPDPLAPGSGGEIEVLHIAKSGEPGRVLTLRRVSKSDDEWRKQLSAAEFLVTRTGATEPAFSGRYWRAKEAGLYRCVACGLALFDSGSKFESGTGWPSFRRPVAQGNVALREDRSLGIARVEVLCARCDSHLGHVFDDGPAPEGKRYCMNSLALRLERAGS
ncbi:MAG: peptide-methionine (R)-S-oxide reductase MsrB [Bryobacteraceae bacterium]|nr:peptide-methionine (R)-S-oxide reductase MsrB [Bryobacteraceae bacterium]